VPDDVNPVTVAAIADLGGQLPDPSRIPDCQLLVIAGDLCPGESIATDLCFLHGPFRAWVNNLRPRVGWMAFTPGDRDLAFERAPVLARDAIEGLPITLLKNTAERLAGLKCWGTPFTLPRGETDFDAERAFLRQDWHFDDGFGRVPMDLDLLICHQPPYAFAEKGSLSLQSVLRRRSPRWCVFGGGNVDAGGDRFSGALDTGGGRVEWVNASIPPGEQPIGTWKVRPRPSLHPVK
jgi:hypothetical protein